MIKRLKNRGANLLDLTEVYTNQIRSLLEFCVPVCTYGLTVTEEQDIERVQNNFLHIALGDLYKKYEIALDVSRLETLEHRRTQLCTKFAIKASKHPKHRNRFVP